MADASLARTTPAAAPHLSVRVERRLSRSFTLTAEFGATPGFTMLLGPSGGGKTTLLNCIAGLERPDSGRIELGGRLLFDSQSGLDVPVPQRRLGYLFQDLALFPHLTVARNVEYGLAGMPVAQRRERAMALLDSMRIAHAAGRKPGEISGGERQRAALARSLVTDPSLLLLDEPLVALDTETKSRILDDLRAWNANHRIPILYVTHSPQEAFALGEQVVVIEAGKILAQGLPQDVLATPRHETVAQLVGFENVFDATVMSLAESQGTMLCRLADSSTELEVPLGWAEAGARVRIAIRAGDIMVATERPHGLSARNTIAGRITAMRQEGVTMTLTVDAGAPFKVRMTPGAARELGLAAIAQIWLVIKTYSINLVE